MKYIILSDIHSNIEALNSVLIDSKKFNPDKYVCLGDIIGYGPKPIETLNKIKDIASNIVIGNHDAGAIGKIDTSNFNEYALKALSYTKEQLNEENISFLNSIKETDIVDDNFEITHGALTNPITDYMINVWIAYTNFKLLKKSLGFIGHTHIPIIFYLNIKDNKVYSQKFTFGEEYKLDFENYKYFINPGSIGQPRDKNEKASYLFYDSEKKVVICERITYNIIETQQEMIKLKFPKHLIERLSIGK